MLSEQHDSLSIYIWLKRWMQCGIRPPKIVISDQSLALMSALVQSFTQYKSLENYLDACFKLISGNNDEKIPFFYIRNDVNDFVRLVTQWSPLKNSKFSRTKQLIARIIGLLIFVNSKSEAEKILEALFIIIFSKYDGLLLCSDTHTICAKSKIYLKHLISASVIELVDQVDQGTEDTQNLNEENIFMRENEMESDVSCSCLSKVGFSQSLTDVKIKLTI